ncbi:hypothetical protein LMG18101_00389 [Ralstonia flaminis]|jgi:hypothetical protein|uniref:Uncharacterized protein n=1 Tax=Ralstonia flaminis TaxID=3058597 RepID=A0ABM9JYI5_9RALS|nr:hypothetical protein LMG18101_00389 [Ralstonia sp. LMG 18101]
MGEIPLCIFTPDICYAAVTAPVLSLVLLISELLEFFCWAALNPR